MQNALTHLEMIKILWSNPKLIQTAMGWDSIWVQGREYRYNNTTEERADIVVRNKFNAYSPEDGTICAVIEVKSDRADHEVQGQLYKAVTVLDRVGKQTQHWSITTGIAIAPEFTKSAIEILKEHNYHVLEWQSRSSGILLHKI